MRRRRRDVAAEGVVYGPCCTARCSRASWESWDEWHAQRRPAFDIRDKGPPPQYGVSPLEQAVFRYVFADTFNGDLSYAELFGVTVAAGGLVVNGAAILLNAVVLQFGEGEYQHYKTLVEAVICFEFAFWVANLARWLYTLCLGSKLDDAARSTVLFQRNAVKCCLHLGELNVFSLLQFLKPDYLLSKFTHLKKTSSAARGMMGPLTLAAGSTLIAFGALFSVLGILAKLSLMDFIFERDPWAWTITDWVAAGGFLNNLIRRDRSEQHKTKVLEMAAVGHYVPAAGFQSDTGNKLVAEWYCDMLSGAIRSSDQQGRKSLGKLAIFAFFANLKSPALLRYHEMAHGAGAATCEARRSLSKLLEVGGRKEWEMVAEEVDSGEPPEAGRPEMLDSAWRVASSLDPLRTDPIEGVAGGAATDTIKGVESCLGCSCCGKENRQFNPNRRGSARRGGDDAVPDGETGLTGPRQPGRTLSLIPGLRRVPATRPRFGVSDGRMAIAPPAGTLVVRVLQCVGLKAEAGCFGRVDCDAYVEITVPDAAGWSWGRTHVAASGDTKPGFGEAFLFLWTGRPCTVSFDIFDHDFGDAPDRLGSVGLSITPLMAATGGWSLHRLQLGMEDPATPRESPTSREPVGDDFGVLVVELGMPAAAEPEMSPRVDPSSDEEEGPAMSQERVSLPFGSVGSWVQACGMRSTEMPELEGQVGRVLRERDDGKLVVEFRDANLALPPSRLSTAPASSASPATVCDRTASLEAALRASERARRALEEQLQELQAVPRAASAVDGREGAMSVCDSTALDATMCTATNLELISGGSTELSPTCSAATLTPAD